LGEPPAGPAWLEERGRRPARWCMRESVYEISTSPLTAPVWRALPAEFPHAGPSTGGAKRLNARGRLSGAEHDDLRDRVRARRGRKVRADGGGPDSQAVTGSGDDSPAHAWATTRGKKIKGPSGTSPRHPRPVLTVRHRPLVQDRDGEAAAWNCAGSPRRRPWVTADTPQAITWARTRAQP